MLKWFSFLFFILLAFTIYTNYYSPTGVLESNVNTSNIHDIRTVKDQAVKQTIKQPEAVLSLLKKDTKLDELPWEEKQKKKDTQIKSPIDMLHYYANMNTKLIRFADDQHKKARYALLVNNKTLHRFPDLYTFHAYGQEHIQPEVIHVNDKTSHNGIDIDNNKSGGNGGGNYINGEQIPSLIDHSSNELMIKIMMDFEIESKSKSKSSSQLIILGSPQELPPRISSSINDSSISDRDKKNNHLFNFNFIPYDNHLILTWRSSMNSFKVTALPIPEQGGGSGMSDTNTFKKQQKVLQDFIDNYSSQLSGHNYNKAILEYTGEDPRLFTTGTSTNGDSSGDSKKGHLWIVFCKRKIGRKPELTMATSPLVLIHTKKNIGCSVQVRLSKILDLQLGPKNPKKFENQRNWSPIDLSSNYNSNSIAPAFISIYAPTLIILQVAYDIDENIMNKWKNEMEMEVNSSSGAGSVNDNGNGNVIIDTSKIGYCMNIPVKTVSKGTTSGPIPWDISQHGEIRGGTPAIKVKNTNQTVHDDDITGNEYFLTFFHTSNTPPSRDPISVAATKAEAKAKAKTESKTSVKYTDVKKTYRMGAMLISTQLPYEMKYITKFPIIHKSMYENGNGNEKWALPMNAYHHVDYVVFPTNFNVYSSSYPSTIKGNSNSYGNGNGNGNGNGDYLYLQYGYQDRKTMMLKLSISELFGSMTRVKTGPYDLPKTGE